MDTQYNIQMIIIELYTWNLYNFINYYHPKRFNLKKEKSAIAICFSFKILK